MTTTTLTSEMRTAISDRITGMAGTLGMSSRDLEMMGPQLDACGTMEDVETLLVTLAGWPEAEVWQLLADVTEDHPCEGRCVMNPCGICGVPSERLITRSEETFFAAHICPRCWDHETDGGRHRDFDIMGGHTTNAMYDSDGSSIDPEQTAFEASMVTSGLWGGGS